MCIRDRDHVSCAAGAAACLNNLFLSICEAGDSVLIPAPYYAAFDADLGAICALKRIPVRLRQGDFALTRSALDKAFDAVRQSKYHGAFGITRRRRQRIV